MGEQEPFFLPFKRSCADGVEVLLLLPPCVTDGLTDCVSLTRSSCQGYCGFTHLNLPV